MTEIKFDKAKWHRDSDGLWLSLKVCKDSTSKALEFVSKIKDRVYLAGIKLFRQGRSLNANGYFWKLCGELAECMSTSEKPVSSLNVYRACIEQVGVYTQFDIAEKAVNTLFHSWGLHGLGWLSEKVDNAEMPGFVTVRLYYGSSTYNTRQMSRLIDLVVQDCSAVGIETLPPRELSLLIDDWGRVERTA